MSEQKRRLLVAVIISERDPLRMLLTRHKGSRRWHFPDGEVHFGEILVQAVYRSFKEDLGIAPAKIDERVCLPTETINMVKESTHVVTLHFIVYLPVGAQLVPREGIEFAWFPMDSLKDPSFTKQVLPSTAEIFRRLNEDD